MAVMRGWLGLAAISLAICGGPARGGDGLDRSRESRRRSRAIAGRWGSLK